MTLDSLNGIEVRSVPSPMRTVVLRGMGMEKGMASPPWGWFSLLTPPVREQSSALRLRKVKESLAEAPVITRPFTWELVQQTLSKHW